MSSTIRINIFEKIKKKKKKKHKEIALLAKATLDCIKGLISRSLTDSYFECDYFHLIDVLKEYEGMKEEIEN